MPRQSKAQKLKIRCDIAANISTAFRNLREAEISCERLGLGNIASRLKTAQDWSANAAEILARSEG